MDNLPALPPSFAEPNQEIDLRRAWQTVARSAWIIVVCVGLAVVAALVAARQVEPTYTASATVRIDDKKSAQMGAAAMYGFGVDNQGLLAMAGEVITSRTLAAEAVDSLGLRLSVTQPQTPVRSRYVAWAKLMSDAPSLAYRVLNTPAGREVHTIAPDSLLGTYPDSAPLHIIGGQLALTADGRALEHFNLSVEPRVQVAEYLRGSITVQPTNKDANVLAISYTGKDSALARDIPNVMARLFVHRSMELDRSGAKTQVDYLERQMAQLQADVTDAESAMRAYLEREQISGVQSEQSMLSQELLNLVSQQRELEQQKENITRALDPLSNPDTVLARTLFLQKLMATPDFQRSGIANNEVARYDALLAQRSTELTRYTPDGSTIRNLDKQIRETQDNIRKRTMAFLVNLDEQLAALRPRIQATQAKLNKVPEQLIEYSKLERNRHIVEEMITLVQGRLKEAQIQEAVQDSTASVLDEAVNPSRQGGSSETLIFAVAVFSGLLVGVAVAFLRDWLDTTIRTEADLANIVGVAVVGIIPNLQQQARSVGYRLPTPKDGDESRPAAGREYQTPAAEAYRTLRTNLNYLTPPRPPRVIVVTSALPGDGKTTTVVNLAVTLAHQGQRVILIDAETRRGTVHDVFGIPPAPGFFDLMYGQASPGECIRRVQMEGGGTIDVLPLGSAPSVNPADLLVAGRLQPLFERLRGQYDYVLIDTPPLNLFTDGALIGAHADALLLVARADKTDREELKYAVAQLRNVQVTLAGTILNDVEFRRSSRYRLGYGYYYDYAR
ncbi:MAG: polysaccharide biosynthesis tyrosine autokinase [Gemmatimonadetes bacterium]|nr:polysaccharide biosynthesis tyrosine autokinase [Gemmatimonadota bacterium]